MKSEKFVSLNKINLSVLFRFLFIFLTGVFVSLNALFGQIRIQVRADNLPLPDQPIYMASSFNNWNPQDPQWKLRKINKNTYTIDISDELTEFEYKFTQGDWNIVEARADGSLLPNRLFSKDQVTDGTVYLAISGWEYRPEYPIHITKVPENTPHDAAIYISGNFNNWVIKDELYRLKKQYDGSYKINIFSKFESLEYKFHRGDWNSAESWKSGKARPNRIVHGADFKPDQTIEVEIENWEDLSSTFNFFSLIDLILLFAAFQGFLLMIVVPTMQDFNREANRLLVILLGLASFFLFCKVIGYYRDVANAFPKLILVPNFALFTFAPVFYFYLHRLLFKKGFTSNQAWPHFILPSLQFLVYIPYFFMDGKRFQHKIVNNETDLKWVFAITFIVALFSNLYYYYKCKKAIRNYSESYIHETAYHQNINYLSAVLVIFMVCMVLGVFTSILFVINTLNNGQITELLENSINLIWIAFSLIGFVLGYYAVHQPEIFKINHEENTGEELTTPEPEAAKTRSSIAEEELESFRARIEEVMKTHKPFLNPNLALNDLATLVKTPSHTLSRVIREGYDKNFFDFINTYRIEEFKENINNPKYHNYTLLGIAFEVGFNSKTAFNRSFKKITGQTPSEYYHSRK